MRQTSNTLVIGDVHFGVKSNSITWLNSQLQFFRKQVFQLVKDKSSEMNIDTIVFLGDVFDVRNSVNMVVGMEVKKLFREMNELGSLYNINIYIIAGNHDFYSPLEEHKDYNVYNVLFGPEFLNENKYIHIIYNKPEIVTKSDGTNILLLPWYETENRDKLIQTLNTICRRDKIHAVYCHYDLENGAYPDAEIRKIIHTLGIPFYSGHIHYIWCEPRYKMYNLGACCSFTFSDVNQDRFFYIINEQEGSIHKIKNVTTPRFYVIYDEEIFKEENNEELFTNSFVELCISSENRDKLKYTDQIKLLKSKYINTNIRVRIFDKDDVNFNVSTTENTGFGYQTQSSIAKYIYDNIPDYLIDNYNKIQSDLHTT